MLATSLIDQCIFSVTPSKENLPDCISLDTTSSDLTHLTVANHVLQCFPPASWPQTAPHPPITLNLSIIRVPARQLLPPSFRHYSTKGLLMLEALHLEAMATSSDSTILLSGLAKTR
ncbi:hypothetical protein C8J56DRAFT_1049713 [Mycena floridula]|nr:hypothetical protein C8J56DRAFT_1049713 [Mycena floridula]